MTIDEFAKKIEERIKLIEKEDKPLLLAVKHTTSLQSNRIWIQGKNADESIIGEYKNREYYVNPNNSPKKFPTKGKTDKATFKNGNPHKTGYFKGWLNFKTTIGRNQKVKTVDLFYTGALAKNWANAEVVSKAQAIRINQHNYIVSLTEKNKAKTERYGNVFGLSKKERGAFLFIAQSEFKKALQ